MTRSKDEAKASYNRICRWYDLLAGGSEKKCKEIGLRKLNVTKGEIALEIGFGTGDCILALAQSVGDSGKIYGIDISEEMLKVTERKVREAIMSGRVELKCGDAVKLPFESSRFDAVFMSFTLELFDTPEIPMVLRECNRVLRTGGRVCIVSMSQKGKETVMMRIYGWMHAMFPNYVDCRPIAAEKGLREAGFAVLDAEEISMWGLPVDVILAAKTSQQRELQ